MIIVKKALPRRTFLRGLGVTMALPLLDCMIPALTAQVNTAARAVHRFGFFYIPNGTAMTHTGIDYWKPTTVGADFGFTPVLKPLEAYRKHVTVISGLHHRSAESLGDGNGDHTRGTGTWLTGTHIKRTEGADLRAGVSADQVIAQRYGRETPLPSLELAILPNAVTGGCDTGYSCAYGTTVSWSSPTTPLPTQSSPRMVFDQLFGDGGPASAQLAALRRRGSIIDSATEELQSLQAKLGPGDKAKVSDYLDVLREVERRIQRAEANAEVSPLPDYERPGMGVPERYDDHVKIMFDLQALAWQADVTRVQAFMFGKELSARMFPEIGLMEQHHNMSHHGNRPENIEKFAKVCTFQTQLFAHLVERLSSTPDGDGTLLDHTLLFYGAGLSDPNIHSHTDLPTLLMGGGIKGNRHIATKMGTPASNLLAAVINHAGIPTEHFGDSTEVLDLNAPPTNTVMTGPERRE